MSIHNDIINQTLLRMITDALDNLECAPDRTRNLLRRAIYILEDNLYGETQAEESSWEGTSGSWDDI